jgi:hypothetical protein
MGDRKSVLGRVVLLGISCFVVLALAAFGPPGATVANAAAAADPNCEVL